MIPEKKCDTFCPAALGHVSAKWLFFRYFSDPHQLLADGDVENVEMILSQLESVAELVGLDSTKASFRSVLHKDFDYACAMFKPALLRYGVPEQRVDAYIATFLAQVEQLVTDDCHRCLEEERFPTYHMPTEDAVSARCAGPLLEVFADSRSFASNVLNTWGNTVFDSKSRDYSLDFSYYLSPHPFETDLSTCTITLNTPMDGFKLRGYYLVRYGLFHEWTAHVATELGAPSSFCDVWCQQWGKELFFAYANPSGQEARSISRGIERSTLAESQEDLRYNLAEQAICKLHDAIFCALQSQGELVTARSRGWEIVARLSLVAANRVGVAVEARVIKPLYTLAGRSHSEFRKIIRDLMDQSGLVTKPNNTDGIEMFFELLLRTVANGGLSVLK